MYYGFEAEIKQKVGLLCNYVGSAYSIIQTWVYLIHQISTSICHRTIK